MLPSFITYFLHGILQSILLWAPLVEPLQEATTPNPWWYPCEIHELWAYLLDANQRPTAEFMDLYWDCLWSKFRGQITQGYNAAIGNRVIPIWQTIGDLGETFDTISEWLWTLWFKIGEVLPEWAFDVTEGLWALWNWLPEPIREGLQTWTEFLAAAPEAIQDWVIEFIGWAIDWINELWEWYTLLGQALTIWWQWAKGVLTDIVSDGYGWLARTLGAAWSFLIWFWADPTGAIASWLSPWWDQLVTFAGDCLDYWYNLWGSYAEDLAEFLEDPMEFLWNIGEDWLNDRLERA